MRMSAQRNRFALVIRTRHPHLIRLGIDLGGTKTEIIALDERRNELLRRREPTPAGDYDATLALIARLVREAEIEIGKRGSVGIGTPGALSPATGLLRNSNSDVPQRPRRSRPTSSARSAARSASPTTRTASRSRKRIDGAARGARGRLRRHPRHRRRAAASS